MSPKTSGNGRQSKSRSKSSNGNRTPRTRLWLGIALLAVAIAVFWFNERYSPEVVDISAGRVNPANNGKLVRVSGRATAGGAITDSVFGVTARAIRLRRRVEIYQSKETAAVWSERQANPPMPFLSADTFARDVRLGAFRLSPDVVAGLNGGEAVDASNATLPETIRARAHPIKSGFQVGDPAAPRIGDLRITFQQLRSPRISIVVRQAGDTLESADDATVDPARTSTFRVIGFGIALIGLALLVRRNANGREE